MKPLIRKTKPYTKKIAHRGIWVEPELLAKSNTVRNPLREGCGTLLQGHLGGLVMTDGPKKMVWIYVDTNHYVGHPDHLKVFATPEAADEWFKKNDPEGSFLDTRS